jgi:hypothetical protein
MNFPITLHTSNGTPLWIHRIRTTGCSNLPTQR